MDLICTDPPFNSGRDYNSFIGDSLAQKKAFTDTWTWDTAAQDARADIEHRAYTSDTYKALDECLKGYDLVLRRAVSGNSGAMRAYLAFMGPRLAEMHRILTQKGSLYLHCDPTASHYLKGVMDTIFGTDGTIRVSSSGRSMMRISRIQRLSIRSFGCRWNGVSVRVRSRSGTLVGSSGSF